MSKTWRMQRDDPNAIRVTCPFDEKLAFEEELSKQHPLFLGYNFQGELEIGASWLVHDRVLTVIWARTQEQIAAGKPMSKMTRDPGPPLPNADVLAMKRKAEAVATEQKKEPEPAPEKKAEPPQEVPIPA